MKNDTHRLDALAQLVEEQGRILLFKTESISGVSGLSLQGRSIRQALDQCTASLPTWKAAKRAVDLGFATELEQFVYHNEPHGSDLVWRKALANLLGLDP